jgi:hypothetical protein
MFSSRGYIYYTLDTPSMVQSISQFRSNIFYMVWKLPMLARVTIWHDLLHHTRQELRRSNVVMDSLNLKCLDLLYWFFHDFLPYSNASIVGQICADFWWLLQRLLLPILHLPCRSGYWTQVIEINSYVVGGRVGMYGVCPEEPILKSHLNSIFCKAQRHP